jgi:CheY-like chemotaxis protein
MSRAAITKLDVLIVDPSPHMASLVGQMLRHLRLRNITEVTDSQAALQALAAQAFHVVIVNDELGPHDGVALTRSLRRMNDNPNRDAAVVMMSAAPDAETIAAARDAGITEFLRKPFAASDVESRLISILTTPRDFVEGGAYAGPDRRRKRTGRSGPERRNR